MNFTDQVVWITGASTGIGEALALECARQGTRLVLSARNVAALERVRGACAPAEALVVPLDLADAATLPAAVGLAMSHYGRLDILVNNAGVKETSLAVDRQLMEVKPWGY